MKSLSLLVWGLFYNLAQDVGLPKRDIQTLTHRFNEEGVSFLTQTLPILAKSLEQGIGQGVFLLPPNFKRSSKGSAIPAFLGSCFKRVFDRKGILLIDADPVAVYTIRQVCYLAYKLENAPAKESKNDAVIENFLKTEEELSSVRIKDDAILRVASLIVGKVFEGYETDDIVPKHGPGVTANVPITRKYEANLTRLPVVSHFGRNFFFNEEDAFLRDYRFPVWSHRDYFQKEHRNVARVILVPKDSRGPRLISCEPSENQWIQQGIREFIERKINQSPLTSGQINFKDQSINRGLAIEGSKTQEFSTLDLKDASDRVTVELVKRVFALCPQLLQDLLASRSTQTMLPSGEIVSLAKFAPMGSACCFPVLATCVYVLSVSVLIGLGIPLKQAAQSVYVYGDDIVVKTTYAEPVMRVLERYSLKVNRNKSFVASRFCESCGMDAFDGNTVTPIRLKQCLDPDLRGDPKKTQPLNLVSTVETAKLLHASGLQKSAEYLYTLSEQFLGRLPFGTLDSPYLCRWTYSTNIPEENILRKGIKWSRTDDKARYPLGVMLRAWAITPKKTKVPETTGYGHFLRVHRSIGSDEMPQPVWGEFTLPKQVSLVVKQFDHYAMQKV